MESQNLLVVPCEAAVSLTVGGREAGACREDDGKSQLSFLTEGKDGSYLFALEQRASPAIALIPAELPGMSSLPSSQPPYHRGVGFCDVLATQLCCDGEEGVLSCEQWTQSKS